MDRKEIKEFIYIELGDCISEMTLREIQDAVEEQFEVTNEEVLEILEYDFGLDYSD